MRDHAIFAALWVALTIVGEFLAQWWIETLPVVASVEGHVIDEGFAFLLRVLVPVFTFVVALMLYAAIRFRDRGDRGEEGGARENRLFSWSWFVVSVALNVTIIIHPGITGLNELFGNPNADLVVQAHGKQWSWRFTYPQYNVSVKDQLVLPVGKRVRFEITTEDVLHSFWVPAFRMKMDAVPGRKTTLFVTPDRAISTRDDLNVRVQCAELCGMGHATMRALVRVVDPKTFAKWMANQGGG